MRDPWVRGSLDVVRPGESVLMLGTGLTMMDIALDLAGRGVEACPSSRCRATASLPREHRARAADVARSPAARLRRPPRSVARYTRLVRRHAAERAAAGGDWRDVVAALRR